MGITISSFAPWSPDYFDLPIEPPILHSLSIPVRTTILGFHYQKLWYDEDFSLVDFFGCFENRKPSGAREIYLIFPHVHIKRAGTFQEQKLPLAALDRFPLLLQSAHVKLEDGTSGRKIDPPPMSFSFWKRFARRRKMRYHMPSMSSQSRHEEFLSYFVQKKENLAAFPLRIFKYTLFVPMRPEAEVDPQERVPCLEKELELIDQLASRNLKCLFLDDELLERASKTTLSDLYDGKTEGLPITGRLLLVKLAETLTTLSVRNIPFVFVRSLVVSSRVLLKLILLGKAVFRANVAEAVAQSMSLRHLRIDGARSSDVREQLPLVFRSRSLRVLVLREIEDLGDLAIEEQDTLRRLVLLSCPLSLASAREIASKLKGLLELEFEFEIDESGATEPTDCNEKDVFLDDHLRCFVENISRSNFLLSAPWSSFDYSLASRAPFRVLGHNGENSTADVSFSVLPYHVILHILEFILCALFLDPPVLTRSFMQILDANSKEWGIGTLVNTVPELFGRFRGDITRKITMIFSSVYVTGQEISLRRMKQAYYLDGGYLGDDLDPFSLPCLCPLLKYLYIYAYKSLGNLAEMAPGIERLRAHVETVDQALVDTLGSLPLRSLELKLPDSPESEKDKQVIRFHSSTLSSLNLEGLQDLAEQKNATLRICIDCPRLQAISLKTIRVTPSFSIVPSEYLLSVKLEDLTIEDACFYDLLDVSRLRRLEIHARNELHKDAVTLDLSRVSSPSVSVKCTLQEARFIDCPRIHPDFFPLLSRCPLRKLFLAGCNLNEETPLLETVRAALGVWDEEILLRLDRNHEFPLEAVQDIERVLPESAKVFSKLSLAYD